MSAGVWWRAMDRRVGRALSLRDLIGMCSGTHQGVPEENDQLGLEAQRGQLLPRVELSWCILASPGSRRSNGGVSAAVRRSPLGYSFGWPSNGRYRMRAP